MIRTIEKKITLFEKEVCLQVTETGDGLQVLLAGGDRSHIGAVAVVSPEGELSVTTFPGHKETVIVEKWAPQFYKKYGQPVVFCTGIHYDGLSKEGIVEILRETDRLLREFLQ